MKFKICILFIIFLLSIPSIDAQSGENISKPWTYWWWMGSAVNEKDIKIQLTEFSKAGLGGVHIVPIYGVKTYEDEFLPFLSQDWLDMLNYTTEQAGILNMGVDITLGTGWPYGGSWINAKSAAKRLVKKEYQINTTTSLTFAIDTILKNNNLLQLFGILATNSNGETLNLSFKTINNKVDEKVPLSDWKLTCFGVANTNQKVKRAAPGGEGLVIDYFDKKAVQVYLNHFDSVFLKSVFPINQRAFYHDSYEVFRADWTTGFPDRFKDLRGYDLIEKFPILLEKENPKYPLLVHDIRETISNLVYSEFAQTWTDWCRNYKTTTRYQAHGSPANLLDLYGLADIPETESFGCSGFSIPSLRCDPDFEEDRFGRPSPLMMKFASSPAHLFQKQLVSSETATWLGNHFKVSLSQVKPQIDELFISGINHIFYHGTTYSPQKEEYPGWLFYASTNFGQTSHFWNELPLLNAYIYECQRILQNSIPDNDILLYFPIDDLWTKYPGEILLTLDVHKHDKWFSNTPFGQTAKILWDNGYSFDYVSDRQISLLNINSEGKIFLNLPSSYSFIVVPPVEYLNQQTLENLSSLAENGAKILFLDKFPGQFAGFQASNTGLSEFNKLKKRMLENKNISVTENSLDDLQSFNLKQESLKTQGLDFVRKRSDDGFVYFISNLSNKFYEDSIKLSVGPNFIEIFDPLTRKYGYTAVLGKFLLQLAPGKSCFIKTYESKPDSNPWHYSFNQDTLNLKTEWKVNFRQNGFQNVESIYTIDTLKSWTEWVDEDLRSFCGKATYSSSFKLKNHDQSKSYKLVFDDINETASISINGVNCGTIWSIPYELEIPDSVLKRDNKIEIVVQNLSANKIKKIDIDGRVWKKFYDINFVDIQYKPFDASSWEYVSSGLIGSIMIVETDY